MVADEGRVSSINTLNIKAIDYMIDKNSIDQDLNQGIELFHKAAKFGNVVSVNNPGIIYKLGRGVKKNAVKAKASEYFHKAAILGHPASQNEIGVCYFFGYGVEQNYNKAVEWFHKAVIQDDCDAQNNLGLCYKRGIGVTKDINIAIKLFQKAAKRGHRKAQIQLYYKENFPKHFV